MNFNEKLIELRRLKGMSQEQLGNELNVTRQTVSKWELGLTTPEMNKLIEMSKLFDISIDELVGNEIQYEPKADTTTVTDTETNINTHVHTYKNVHYEYKSKRTVFGLPLVHINVGFKPYKAKGVIAIGNISTGIVSLGLLSLGIISMGVLSIGLLLALGVLSIGILAIGAITAGILAVGGFAFGYFAIGGIAIGVYSIGGCSIASDIALGGFARAKIAIGENTFGTAEFYTNGSSVNIDADELSSAINQHLPHTPEFIKNIFLSFGK